jgi:kumamolisin
MVDVTILVRPRAPVPLQGAAAPMSREDYSSAYGASPEDLAHVADVMRADGLTVVSTDAARRSVMITGTVAAVSTAFGTTLHHYDCAGTSFRARTGMLMIPKDLEGIVTGVFGLDERPQARAQFRTRPASAAAVSYTPLQVGALYAFPPGDGAGQTIALIELGGGFVQSDLDTYFSGLGVKGPTVTAVAVDGASNVPTKDANGPDGEVMLDIEVTGALAPGAAIAVYFAPNTDKGFLDAITMAVNDTARKPTIISISWGGPESTWTQQAFTGFDTAFADAANLGITVCVASGDDGSTDGATDGKQHVDFPASSPHALACGGTTLRASGTAIASETVWNDGTGGGASGGGISDAFPLPTWQSSAGVPPSANAGGHVGRGVPDVAGDADPETGYAVRVDGSDTVIGGTSAVAPLWSALIARINAASGKPVGFINPTLYANARALHDITSGSNGSYRAGVGWDACTGLGSPNGALLVSVLASR